MQLCLTSAFDLFIDEFASRPASPAFFRGRSFPTVMRRSCWSDNHMHPCTLFSLHTALSPTFRICTLSPEAQTLLSQWLRTHDPTLDNAVHSILSKVDRWFMTKHRDQCMVFDCGCGIQEATPATKPVFQNRVLTFPRTPMRNKAPLQKACPVVSF